MKTVEEVATKLSGAKIFTLLDANSGYWQIPIVEESSKLLNFNTHFGRYRFTRLPFGLISAAEVYQKMMSQALDC